MEEDDDLAMNGTGEADIGIDLSEGFPVDFVGEVDAVARASVHTDVRLLENEDPVVTIHALHPEATVFIDDPRLLCLDFPVNLAHCQCSFSILKRSPALRECVIWSRDIVFWDVEVFNDQLLLKSL